MKVLAINSSPMMDEGNTALILNPFLEGMREEGANVELFYTRKLRINPCQGEFNCWVKTPGKCFQNDDMQMIDPKMRDADILVFATPVYCDGITGPMKNLLDRTVSQVYPFFEMRQGHCRHPLREDTKSSKVVLVSNCGFWEMDNFDPMLAHMKAYCRNGDNEFVGALLRPHGGALKPMMEMGAPVDDIFDAAKEAGRQLVRDGRISEQTLNIVSRELMPRDMYVYSANQHFRDELEAHAKIG
jgi:multimeric flavodoxin WrbA